MRRRRWPWLLAAVVLLGLAVFLMSRDDPKQPEPVWKRVVLPRAMKSDERARAEQRKTLAPAPPVVLDAGEAAAPPPPARPRDPVLAALPSTMKRGVVVVEANAIRHSPVGELLIDCLTSRDDGRSLARMRERTGIDPLEDLDRVAIADDALVLSGHFAKAKWAELFPGETQAWGHQGTIYENPRPEGREGNAVGTWGDQLLVIADTTDQVQAVLDRIEDRGIQGPPVLDESQTYGDIYGVLTAGALAEMLPEDQAGLAEKLKTMADRVELHVDASRDVGMVAQITGPNGEDTRDLGKTMGAALALGRLKAQADGKTELAELMDLARVIPGDGDFRVELGLPLEVLQKQLEKCVADNRARRADAGR